MNKRVIFLANYHKGDYKGGIANILECYCNNFSLFSEEGIDVFWANLDIHYSKNKIISFIQKIINFHYEKKLAFKKVFEMKPDIIHIHTSRGYTLYKDLIIARYLKKMFLCPIIISIHFAEAGKIFSNNKKIKAKEIKIMNSFVDKIICLSKNTANELASLVVKSKICVLYTFHCFNYKNHNSIECNKSPLQIMFMGSIDERKGVFDLIEAIKQSNCKTHLKIYGGFLNDSFTKNRFERLIRNDASIEYCGYVSGEKKEEAYSNSDVFVLPSYAEGMPIVIMEALAKGCAIVSTNVGAIPEVIGNENGYIVNPGDICAIRSAIEQIDLDRAKLKTIKRNNIEKSKNFSLEKNVKFLCSIYGGLFNDQ